MSSRLVVTQYRRMSSVQIEHSVQCIDSKRDLGQSTLIVTHLQSIADDPFGAADIGFHWRPALEVVGRYLSDLNQAKEA